MALSAETNAVLEDVLARFGVENATLHDIRTGRVNRHWRVEAGTSAYVLRRYNEQRSTAAIRYEHKILQHLATKAWPVAVPVIVDGSETTLCVDERYYSLLPLLPGPAPHTASYARLKGRLLAQLHQDLAAWEAPGQRDGFGRTWELDIYVAAQSTCGSLNELLFAFGQMHPDLARAVRSQKYAMLRELSRLGYGELPVVPGHFDFHHDNLLFQRGALTGLLDFDLAHLDARVADIASSISLDCLAPPAYNEIDSSLAAEFIAGYVEHTVLSDTELQLIVPLVHAALLWLVAWRLAQWARGEQPEQALRSIERSVGARFPSLAASRSTIEVAILQGAAETKHP